jgi:serine/threonine protein kinase
MHGKGVIHRDIRCANILLNKDLDIKVSDFGIAMWLEDKDKGLELPFYASDVKAVYTISQKQDTLDFQFDLRLLAIVLSKLLLYGNEVETKELLDYDNNCITKELTCELPPYRKLIDFCFSRDAIAPLVLTLATSIVAQSSIKLDGVNSKAPFELKQPDPVSLNYVATIATSSTLTARAIQMRSAIRRLAAVSPDDLIALFEKFANEKNIRKNLQASQESPKETQNETNKVDVEELISQLGSDNWRKRRDAIIDLGAAGIKEDRVIRILKEMLHEERAEEVRVWAAIILGRFGEPQVKHTLIQLFSFCTTNDADLVRREAARSLHVLVEKVELFIIADPSIRVIVWY